MLVVFDGIDGAGKSTHMKLISRWMKSKKINHITKREPGGTKISELIRDVFVANKMDPISQLMLVSAARLELTNELAQEKSLILCDRFIDSTYAYQGKYISKEIIDYFIKISAKVEANFTFLFLTTYKDKTENYMDEVSKANRENIVQLFKEQAKLNPKKYLILPDKNIYEQNYIIKRKMRELLSKEILKQSLL